MKYSARMLTREKTEPALTTVASARPAESARRPSRLIAGRPRGRYPLALRSATSQSLLGYLLTTLTVAR
jgi:hypothetical protein